MKYIHEMLDYIKECPGTIPGYILVVAVFLLLAVMARYIIIVLAINNYMHKTTILKHFINCFCGMAIYMAFLVVDYFVVKLIFGRSPAFKGISKFLGRMDHYAKYSIYREQLIVLIIIYIAVWMLSGIAKGNTAVAVAEKFKEYKILWGTLFYIIISNVCINIQSKYLNSVNHEKLITDMGLESENLEAFMNKYLWLIVHEMKIMLIPEIVVFLGATVAIIAMKDRNDKSSKVV